jgi:hypothetical protein
MSTHSFYFKTAYTCQTINYDINLDMSIENFINYVKDKIRVDFNIDNNYDIEIVKAGNPDNINGHDAELAPALEATNFTILQTYGDNYKQIAFYIRKINRPLRIIIPDYVENDNDNVDNPPNAPRENINRNIS